MKRTSYREDRMRPSRWSCQDAGDGTVRAREIHLDGQELASELFPNRHEAEWFCDAMNQGFLMAGAMMRVHIKRLAEAREIFKQQHPERADLQQNWEYHGGR